MAGTRIVPGGHVVTIGPSGTFTGQVTWYTDNISAV